MPAVGGIVDCDVSIPGTSAVIVEFIGAPGVGKTTLIPAAIAAFQEQGLRAYTTVEAARPFARRTLLGAILTRLSPARWQRPLLWQLFYQTSFLHRFSFFAKHPRLLKLVLGSQWRRPPAADGRKRRVLYWYFRQTGYYDFLKAHALADEVLIFDEGFIHRVVQLFASSVEVPRIEKIQSYVDLLPVPDLVIGIQAPPDVCQERIYSRGLWQRFSDKQPEEMSRFVAHAHEAVNLTMETIKKDRWPILEIDNSSDDPAKAAAQLQRKLLQLKTAQAISPKLQIQ